MNRSVTHRDYFDDGECVEGFGQIYGIFDICPGCEPTCIYVGQTTRSMWDRFWEHLKNCKKELDHPLYVHMSYHDRLEPRLLERVPVDEIDDAERRWIRYYRSSHWIANLSDGGFTNRGVPMRESSRQKIREAAKRRGMPEAHAALRGQPRPREWVEKVAVSRRGQPLSLEAILQRQETRYGPLSDEARARITKRYEERMA